MVRAAPGGGRPPLSLLIGLAGTLGLLRDHQGTLHLRNSPEQAGVAAAARLLDEQIVRQTPVFSTHPLLAFYVGGDPYDPARWPSPNRNLYRDAADGTVWFWDSHYTPNLGLIASDPRWHYLGGTIASDTTWAGAFFERRTGDVPPVRTLLPETGVDQETWFAAAHLVEAGAGYALRAAEKDPRNPVRWQILADRLGAVGRFPEAWAALDQAERLLHGDATTYAVRAFLHYAEGNLEEALISIESAVQGRPTEPYFRFQKGQILWELGRREEARPWILETADQLTDRWEVQLLTGDVHFEEGEYERSLHRYNRTLALKPDHRRAREQAGQCGEILRGP